MGEIEIVRFMRAEELPPKIQTDVGIFNGFVEIRFKRGSGILLDSIVPLTETPAETLRNAIREDELEGIDIFGD